MSDTTVHIGDLKDNIDARASGTTSEYIRGAVRMREEIESAIEAADMADELEDDWWEDWLYDAAREEVDIREQRMIAERRSEREESEPHQRD